MGVVNERQRPMQDVMMSYKWRWKWGQRGEYNLGNEIIKKSKEERKWLFKMINLSAENLIHRTAEREYDVISKMRIAFNYMDDKWT